jgi:anion-transporting  ArsA/GET3 family ATPase
MAAKAGLTTLIVEVEGKSGLGNAFGRSTPLTYEEVTVSPGGGPDGAADIRARTLTPDDALIEYLRDHGMKRVSKRLTSSGAIDVVATAVPGIKDILVLGKVKSLERSNDADLIILDAPAAGHAVTFLMSARGLLDAVRVGPIRAQAKDVIELLTDPERCQILLVTLPEETPVNEVVETAFKLEDRVGVSLAGVVVNGLYPDLAGLDADPGDVPEADALRAAAAFRQARHDLQTEQVARLADALPLPQVHLPFLFTTEVGPAEIDALADAFAESIQRLPDPAVSAPG